MGTLVSEEHSTGFIWTESHPIHHRQDFTLKDRTAGAGGRLTTKVVMATVARIDDTGHIQAIQEWLFKEFSGTPLMWTPWGLGEVSCIERCPHFRGKISIKNAYMYLDIA